MKQFVRILSAIVFLIMTAYAGAQEEPVTVSVGEPPFVTNAVESALAQITITENYPDALHDGYFTLFHFETPDNPLAFTDASYVSGSATDIQFAEVPGGRGAAIYVDADDSRIDKVTVQLYAILQFFPVRNAAVRLRLGEDASLIPEGGIATGLGVSETLIVAYLGGFCCISIGSSPTLELEVGDRVTLPLVHDHPSYVDVQSFQPGIVSVETVTLDSVEILALMPGTALLEAWNPLWQTGYLRVTVTGSSIAPMDMRSLLIDEIEALVPADLQPGPANALASKLRAAYRAIQRGNANAACGQLGASTNQIQAHAHLHPVLAQELLEEIRLIVEGVDC